MPSSAPTVRVLLTEDVAADAELEVRELKRAGLRFSHRVEALPDGVRVTHSVVIEGPAAQVLGPVVTADLPDAVEALVKLAS